MNVSVDISYYPLCDEFVPHIHDFIERLHAYKDINIKTNRMSTQIFGEYEHVMSALTMEIGKSFLLPHSVFIMKIVNADLQ